MDVISEKILISGPWVTDREVNYVADAARNGWNQHCFDYIDKFEAIAREYLNVNYALGTSSCTGALHLALLALGIGENDEVILPESTWVATANVVEYVHATPVFVDIDQTSWTINVEKIREAITPKTKAIIAVHLYGQPCDMKEIMKIAKEYNLYVIEDAAEAMGGEVDNKKVGSIGDIGCFSFHGSKALVMGEGGLFVTNQIDLYNKAKYYCDQSKHPSKRFFNTEIGYKYRISNLQAAFGAAQMERVDQIIDKKREIFSWYQERLNDLPDTQLNSEMFEAKNTYWMPTLLLGDSYQMDGYQLSEELLKRNIDTRPFFYPLTMMPMYERKKRFKNEVAYRYSSRAINLPAGCTMTEEEVDYVCAHIKNILCPNMSVDYHVGGWLAYREFFKRKYNSIKNEAKYSFIQLENIDFKNRLIAIKIDVSRAEKKVIQNFGRAVEAEAIYVKCQHEDKFIALKEIGFEEVRCMPKIFIANTSFYLIQSEFKHSDGYEHLMRMMIK